MTRVSRTLCAVSLLSLAAGPAAAQETMKTQPAGAPQAMPPLPKPGPEHEILKKDQGTWDATVESWMAPGAPPTTSKGVETRTLGPGGLWLLSEFKGDFMGTPFQGHGVMGYDPNKKKYVGTWVDSMSSGLALTEAIYDPAKKTMTGWMEGPDMSGKVSKMKEVTEYKDADTQVFTMYNVGADGKEATAMKITYKRRK